MEIQTLMERLSTNETSHKVKPLLVAGPKPQHPPKGLPGEKSNPFMEIITKSKRRNL